MKQISTGAGLVTLSFGIVSAALISSSKCGGNAVAAAADEAAAGLAARATHATGMQANFRNPSAPPQATGLPRNSVATGSACRWIEPDIRFTTVHPIDQCDGLFAFAALGGACDIDGDGDVDFISQCGSEIDSNMSGDSPLLCREDVMFDGTKISFRYQTIMAAAPVLAFIQSQPDLPAS
jgi:hypothetical protein